MSNLPKAFNRLAAAHAAAAPSAGPPPGIPAPPALLTRLERAGLLLEGEEPRCLPLATSLTAVTVRVGLAAGPIVAKQALAGPAPGDPSLAAAARAAVEACWLRLAREVTPSAVPEVLWQDGDWLLLEFLDPVLWPSWDALLARGETAAAVAAQLGRLLGRIHAATAGSTAAQRELLACGSDRVDPGESRFAAVEKAHPDCVPALRELDLGLTFRLYAALHGDVHPENVLVGPRGPVLIDADRARFGDPAFDLASAYAFSALRHIRGEELTSRDRAALDALVGSYRLHIVWEMQQVLLARVARLAPALLLDGVDGASPVAFLSNENERNRLRRVARGLLLARETDIDRVSAALFAEFGR